MDALIPGVIDCLLSCLEQPGEGVHGVLSERALAGFQCYGRLEFAISLLANSWRDEIARYFFGVFDKFEHQCALHIRISEAPCARNKNKIREKPNLGIYCGLLLA